MPKLAYDAAGNLWIAWYSNATGAIGLYVQQLNPATGAPLGPPTQAPGSETVNNNSFGSALTCATTCRLVYGNAPAASPNTNAVVSWWPGAAPVTIASLVGTSQGAGRVVTAAYRADGRLWVAWWDGKVYRAVLGDATGAGGEVQDAGVPKGSENGAYALAGMAVGDNLLLAANYAWKAPADPAPFAVFVNTVAPPAPVTKAPGPRDVQLQPGPGKTFRIQVQYTLPKACTGAARCTLRGELRTRTGRRLYAVTPLPGDTKLVLGTRREVHRAEGQEGQDPLLHRGQQVAAPEGAVLDRGRIARRRDASARVVHAQGRERGALGARRAHQGLDRAHQVGGPARPERDSVGERRARPHPRAVARRLSW